MKKVVSENGIKIITDMTIQTSNKIEYNKPDIVIFDYNKNEIIIIDVGITNTEKIKQTEILKLQKYQNLAKKLYSKQKIKTLIMSLP